MRISDHRTSSTLGDEKDIRDAIVRTAKASQGPERGKQPSGTEVATAAANPQETQGSWRKRVGIESYLRSHPFPSHSRARPT
jgi:hypothetical protein